MKKISLLLFILISVVLVSCKAGPTFYFVVKDISGDTKYSATIIYDTSSDKGVFEYIKDTIEVDYSESQYGIFINGVGDFYPTEYQVSYNYYLSLYVNDESAAIGIDQVEYKEGLVVSLRETTMLSDIDLEVDNFIYDFLKNTANKYIKEDSVNAFVVSGIKHLSKYNYKVPNLLDMSYPKFKFDTVSNAYFSTIVKIALNDEVSESNITEILNLTPSNIYEMATYLNTLQLLNSELVTDKQISVINNFMDEEVTYMDPDFAAIALMAVSARKNDADVKTYIDSMTNYLADSYSKEGIVSNDKANAASTAMSILGLVSVDFDDVNDSFVIDNIGLIEALMSFRGETGFKYLLDDDKDDLAFSTPQAFAALSVYKILRDQAFVIEDKALNLWDLN